MVERRRVEWMRRVKDGLGVVHLTPLAKAGWRDTAGASSDGGEEEEGGERGVEEAGGGCRDMERDVGRGRGPSLHGWKEREGGR